MAAALTYPFSRLTQAAAEVGVTLEQLEHLSNSAKELRRELGRNGMERRRLQGEQIGRPLVISEAAYLRALTLESEGLSHAEIATTLTAEGHARGNGSTEWTRHSAGRLLARRKAAHGK
jgi:hypothetical protein